MAMWNWLIAAAEEFARGRFWQAQFLLLAAAAAVAAIIYGFLRRRAAVRAARARPMLAELAAAKRELEHTVSERTAELVLLKGRFETALRGAKVYIFSQDRDLRYRWVYSPRGDDVGANMLGRTDEEILSGSDREILVSAKRKVMETGEPIDIEAYYPMPEGRVLFAFHIDPVFGPDKRIDGVRCAAIDIWRLRSLESEQLRLTAELRTALARYEIALRGSNVTVFTQDRDLRYTSISNPFLGLQVDEIVGRSEEELIPAENRAAVVAIKRPVLDSGEPRDGEVEIKDGTTQRWFDLHIEPLRDDAGHIVGLTCAAVDITARKEAAEHLHLLMRELTHRSKNLLAMVQALARQTARYTGSMDTFIDQFNARLQAFARSHDILVQEEWHGASLGDLVQSQVAPYVDQNASQLTLSGPPLRLSPEAAQSLGLALHELAANAAKYGALSAPEGRIAITWEQRSGEKSKGIEVQWTESGGPKVVEPAKRGFGSLVIEDNLARALESDVEMKFLARGLCCRINIPEKHLLPAALARAD
jgi:PAS domain S-box-containing protein